MPIRRDDHDFLKAQVHAHNEAGASPQAGLPSGIGSGATMAQQ
jgi:hypothetical protein